MLCPNNTCPVRVGCRHALPHKKYLCNLDGGCPECLEIPEKRKVICPKKQGNICSEYCSHSVVHDFDNDICSEYCSHSIVHDFDKDICEIHSDENCPICVDVNKKEKKIEKKYFEKVIKILEE